MWQSSSESRVKTLFLIILLIRPALFNLVKVKLMSLQNTPNEPWKMPWVPRPSTSQVTQLWQSTQASGMACQLEWWLLEESLMKPLFLMLPMLMRRSEIQNSNCPIFIWNRRKLFEVFEIFYKVVYCQISI